MATKRKTSKSRSGRTLTYQERKAAGRSTISVTLHDLTVAMADGLSVGGYAPSRSSVIARALREAYTREHGTNAPWEVQPKKSTE